MFFGPYLAERQWGTVREDYSHNGDCWKYLSHDKSRYTVYLHGEDGLFGWSDYKAKLCVSLALWNGKDKILKERLFGLTGPEGNHGEDVKEVYYYLDNVSDHSYMRALYRYPQSPFPYKKLIRNNKERKRADPEFELTDTGVFDQDYWDICMEFAKEDCKTCLCRYTVYNRGNNPATLHILPQIWLRNTWSHCSCDTCHTDTKPSIQNYNNKNQVRIDYSEGSFFAKFDQSPTKHDPDVIFTDNESADTCKDEIVYKKDAFHQFIISGETSYVNPKKVGTKCAAVYCITVNPGCSKHIQFCLWPVKTNPKCCQFGSHFENILKAKATQAKRFYAKLLQNPWSEEEKNVAQQAYAGLLWNKMFYCYDVEKWFKTDCKVDWDSGSELSDDEEDKERFGFTDPCIKDSNQAETCLIESFSSKISNENPNEGNGVTSTGSDGSNPENKDGKKLYKREERRNIEWLFHLHNCNVISMPDKWEFPWYAAWDLAFQMIPFTSVDLQFTKKQLLLFLSDNYLHPNGQMPAYEFNFSDTNPPVHAWACLHVYRQALKEDKDSIHFLKKCFHRLTLNYTWWINAKKIPGPGHLYGGGFLGMDNISVYNRSFGIPPGYLLAQADGSGWMAFYSLKLFEMAVELSQIDLDYLDLAERFLKYFFLLSGSINSPINQAGFWDEEDQFFYDVLLPLHSDEIVPLCIRSLVGLVPLFACASITVPKSVANNPKFLHLQKVMVKNKVIFAEDHFFLSLISKSQLQQILSYVLKESEFLSPYGIRSLSKHYEDHPYHPPVETVTGNKVGSGKTESSPEEQKKDIDQTKNPPKEQKKNTEKRQSSLAKKDTGTAKRPQAEHKNTNETENPPEEQKQNKGSTGNNQVKSKVERNPGEKLVLEDDECDIDSNASRHDESAKEVTVKYSPGESICGMFGGNSNWRGPIWLCMNYLLLEALETYYSAYGDNFKVELPTGSKNFVTLQQVVREISKRIVSIFIPGKDGKRPVHGCTPQYAEEENWRHLVLFYEFFNAENGRGCGASHQTGWTALVVEFLKKKYS